MVDISAVVAEWLAEAALHSAARSRPLVTLSYAQSLDGSLSLRRGEPLRLSSPDTMRLTHQLRAQHDAILVGIGTVLADDPRLTVRLVAGKQPQPVILDSHLRIPAASALLNDPPLMPWIATLETDKHPRWRELQSQGVKLLSFNQDAGGFVPWEELLDRLYQRGIHRLMVEGGASVITSLLSSALADYDVIAVSPVFVGGLPLLERTLSPRSDGRFPGFEEFSSQTLGGDVVVWGKLRL